MSESKSPLVLPLLADGSSPNHSASGPLPAPPAWLAGAHIEGRILTSPVSGGKRLQAVCLENDAGASVLIGYRPDPSLYQFEGKRVVVVGTVSNPALASPERQAVLGWHLSISQIALAPGERPYDPLPTELPPPPRFDTLADLERCSARYLRIVGVLAGAERQGTWSASLRIRLQDGELTIAKVRLQNPEAWGLRQLLDPPANPAPALPSALPAPPRKGGLPSLTAKNPPKFSFGADVTVVVWRDGETLVGLAVCPGVAERCGCGIPR